MNFIYFKGPFSDMADLLNETQECSICKKEHDYCFNLEFSITEKFGNDEKEGKVGCYDCLKSGHFEFWHDTEFGVIDNSGISKVYSHNIDNPPTLSEKILKELKRTPQIITNQQELWLTHCNDFMVYLGTWEPMDFYKNSSTGDGRDLFLEMTDKEISFLWDKSLPAGQTILEEWHPTYYTFECLHCKKLRGNWDCD
jgi:uncharacterized protein CbrC (UPF0167 family)